MVSRKRSLITKDILKTALGLGVIAIGITTPFFMIALLSLCFHDRYPKSKFRNSFNNLKRSKLIQVRKQKNKVFISLTAQGQNEARKIQIDNLLIKEPIHWDGKWRIIMFDILESLRITRDLLRIKLKQWKFYRLQESVWIFPYDCEKEVNLIREFFNLSPRRLILFITKNIPNENYLKRLFNLKNK